jgi:hypothetical protein
MTDSPEVTVVAALSLTDNTITSPAGQTKT